MLYLIRFSPTKKLLLCWLEAFSIPNGMFEYAISIDDGSKSTFGEGKGCIVRWNDLSLRWERIY